VIEKPFPEPSSVPYWMGLVTLIGVLMTLRGVRVGIEEEKSNGK